MTKPNPLYPTTYYHIYNRGNNRENIFLTDDNYRHFLMQYGRYIEPVAATYAYCLLRNHFHLVVRILTEEEQRNYQKTYGVSETPEAELPLDPSSQFSHFFNAYAKAFNKTYQRTGSLFEGRFKRIPVASDRYLTYLIAYVHRNPQRHGFVEDFRDWPYSSYQATLGTKATRIRRAEVLQWFNGSAGFREGHRFDNERPIQHLITDDFDE